MTDDRRLAAIERQIIWQSVARVLTPHGVEQWFKTLVPDLGSTPNLALEDGRFEDVAKVVNSYLETSFE